MRKYKRWSQLHRFRDIALLFHDLGTRRGWVVSSTPRPHFTPREGPGTYCTGGWVGPRAGLDRLKISPPPGFDPWTVQPVVSRYTNRASRPMMSYDTRNINDNKRLSFKLHITLIRGLLRNKSLTLSLTSIQLVLFYQLNNITQYRITQLFY
jgi:hypothetical protein